MNTLNLFLGDILLFSIGACMGGIAAYWIMRRIKARDCSRLGEAANHWRHECARTDALMRRTRSGPWKPPAIHAKVESKLDHP